MDDTRPLPRLQVMYVPGHCSRTRTKSRRSEPSEIPCPATVVSLSRDADGVITGRCAEHTRADAVGLSSVFWGGYTQGLEVAREREAAKSLWRIVRERLERS